MPLSALIESGGKHGNLNPIVTAARRLREEGYRVQLLLIGSDDRY